MEKEERLPPWDREPRLLADLMEKYFVEAKISGRDAATTLFLVHGKQRNGETHDMAEDQTFKLFLVS